MLKFVSSIVLVVWALVSCAPENDLEAGIAGATTLAVVSGEATLAACPNGGIELEYGIDANGNQELEKTEIAGVKVICHGQDGVATNLEDYATLEALAAVALSGDFNDLENAPDLSTLITADGLSRVGTTGNYEDLLNAPDLSIYTQTIDFANVAFTGSYLNLRDTPDLTTLLTLDALSPVAVSGNYSDLADVPDLSQFAQINTLAAVAMSGDYGDLTNTPDYVMRNILATVAETGDYTDLLNIPAGMTLLADSDGDTSIATEAVGQSNSLMFTVGNMEAMALNSAGNLGIGTISPAHPLHIVTEALETQMVDQIHTGMNNTWNMNTTDVAQSFLVSTNGKLGSISLVVYLGDGVEGNEMYQQEISVLTQGWNSVIFDNPVAVIQGQMYTFQLMPSEAGTVLAYCDGWSDICYSAGDLYWYHGMGTSDVYSLAFKTHISGVAETNAVVVTDAGQLGIGTANPKAPVHVNDGDVYLETIGKGVILKSPNGSCWRWTPANDGSMQSASIVCP